MVQPVFRLGFFGFSKERPKHDHHAKAPIHEIRQISYGFQVKSGRFRTDFVQISGEICRISHMKSGGFCTDFRCEIRRISHMISKDQLPGMVSPMFQ